MTERVGNPFTMFFDRYGRPLDGGHIYVGEVGEDPETLPVDVFWDSALSIAAAQPLDTIGGVINRAGNPAFPFIAEDNYSIRVRDADGAEVFYVASALVASVAYQPLDADLTAIAALATSAYGRGVLAIADAAALRTYAGITTPANPTESLILAVSDETTALTAGTSKLTFRMPYAFTPASVKASVTSAPTGANLIVDINEGGVSILSTKLSIDASEKTSTTAASAAVLSDATLAADAEITIDIDQIGSTIAGAGLKVTLIGVQP